MDFAITDLAAHFTGTWRFSRDIVATDGEPMGQVSGTVTFTPGDGALVYHETGELHLPGYTGPVTRTLLYHPDGARAAVHFDHGGFFHDVDLTTGRWSTDHPCRDDLYHGEYRLFDADHWLQKWAVAGPTKDHVITTRFTRA
ncbi:DUF6314 family protein [Amycolatopsis sp. FDAARGOS 1241]|uniref:DUF6314 family protein n=1 Tax=Amycolatopsis sp. FDAARGOS 1241 TaxID=2778070 RepID=UPI001951609F|nr:DUF6314 family protein [Amycolatopsis sp. FDAARGOS 1241]QRP48806.1 hypothetical protein I6J71_13890 [Amycolatopsis sp. FDAARGOS 1241]